MRLSIGTLALLVLGGLCTSAANADDASVVAEIKSARTALNEAFAKHDVATIKAMMTPDHIAVTSFYGRPVTTAEELEALAGFKSEHSDFIHTTVTILGPAAVQITFEKHYKGTFEDKPLPPLVFVSESWLKQDGKWRQQLYEETPIAAE